MPRRNLLILTAIAAEARAIAGRFDQRFILSGRPLHFTHHDDAITLHAIGIAAIRLPALPDPPPDAILLAGLAGALDPALAIGDVLIDESSTWPSRAPGFPRRKIHSAQRLIGTAADKSALFARTAAAAVEMEFSKVAQWAGRCRAPLLHIRAISDAAGQGIDPAVLKCIDPFGQPRAAAIARSLLRPAMIAQFMRLNKTSRIALASLASAVETVLAL